jgi:hypothetical protein
MDSTATATHAGLLLTKQTGQHVIIANGNRVHSPDYCRHLRIMICGKHFSIDFALDGDVHITEGGVGHSVCQPPGRAPHQVRTLVH